MLLRFHMHLKRTNNNYRKDNSKLPDPVNSLEREVTQSTKEMCVTIARPEMDLGEYTRLINRAKSSAKRNRPFRINDDKGLLRMVRVTKDWNEASLYIYFYLLAYVRHSYGHRAVAYNAGFYEGEKIYACKIEIPEVAVIEYGRLFEFIARTDELEDAFIQGLREGFFRAKLTSSLKKNSYKPFSSLPNIKFSNK